MTHSNAFEYKKKEYEPNFVDSLGVNINKLDNYDKEEFDKLIALAYKKNGLDITLNINSLSKQLKLDNTQINKYLIWLYKKGSIVLYSNGYENSFYDKEKNTDKNIKDIYLIRLKKERFL